MNLQELFREPAAFFDQAIYRVAAVLIALCCHEWGHAYVAHLCGDDTAREAGRMTLNPLAHLDPLGTVLMFFAGVGYARPVPVNPYRFKGNKVRCDLQVSLAGIGVNLILFLLFTTLMCITSRLMWKPEVIKEVGLTTLVSYRYSAVWSIMTGEGAERYASFLASPHLLPLVRLCALTAYINLSLALFNLLPLPPLDGYHVFNDILFGGRIQLSRRGFQIAMMIVMVLALQGFLGRIIVFALRPLQDLVLLPFGALWG